MVPKEAKPSPSNEFQLPIVTTTFLDIPPPLLTKPKWEKLIHGQTTSSEILHTAYRPKFRTLRTYNNSVAKIAEIIFI